MLTQYDSHHDFRKFEYRELQGCCHSPSWLHTGISGLIIPRITFLETPE